jgi:hypothetical protein
MLTMSTGLANALATDYGLASMMGKGVIFVYDGTRPPTPDQAPGVSNNLLGKITTDGKVFYPDTDPNDAGLVFSWISPGGLLNSGTWVLKGEASGTATWFRWFWYYTDPNADSTFYPRIDGDVGVTSGDLILETAVINSSTTRALDIALLKVNPTP